MLLYYENKNSILQLSEVSHRSLVMDLCLL